MPRLSAWAIRAALIYFVVGVALGSFLLTSKALGKLPFDDHWIRLHEFILLFGWLIQLIVGVGYWILPRFNRRRRPTSAVFSLILLNSGVIILVVRSLLSLGIGLFPSITAEMLSIIFFALQAWPRLRKPSVVL